MKLVKWMCATAGVMGLLLAGCGPVPAQDPTALQQSQSELTPPGDPKTPMCSDCPGLCQVVGWEDYLCDHCWTYCMD